MIQVLAVLFLVVIGECLSVYAQVKTSTLGKNEQQFAKTSYTLFALWTLGGFLLVAGYVFGSQVFASVWKITAISVTSILMVEPALLIVFTDHKPSRFEALGFLFGAVGLIITMI